MLNSNGYRGPLAVRIQETIGMYSQQQIQGQKKQRVTSSDPQRSSVASAFEPGKPCDPPNKNSHLLFRYTCHLHGQFVQTPKIESRSRKQLRHGLQPSKEQ